MLMLLRPTQLLYIKTEVYISFLSFAQNKDGVYLLPVPTIESLRVKQQKIPLFFLQMSKLFSINKVHIYSI